MKNETKFAILVSAILLATVVLAYTFNFSVNFKKFQLGYTVYNQQGNKIYGFIPPKLACQPTCGIEIADAQSTAFATKCEEQGFRLLTDSCCASYCTGSVRF